MESTFKRTLYVFIGHLVILLGILFFIIYQYSQYGSIPDTIQMVDFSGILITLLGAAVLILTSVVSTFLLARGWIREQPEHANRIFRYTLIINIIMIVLFGGLAGGVIVLRTLWTIGYF